MKLIKTPKIILLSFLGMFTLCQPTPMPEQDFTLTSPKASPVRVEGFVQENESQKQNPEKDPKAILKKRVYKSAKLAAYSTLAIAAATSGAVLGCLTKDIITWAKSGHIPKIMIKFFPENTKYAPLAMGASSVFSFCAAWYFLQNAYNIAKGKI